MRIVAIRHPRTEDTSICYGRLDVPAPASQEELERLRQALHPWLGRGVRFELWSSPSWRCRHVGEALAGWWRRPLRISSDLAELDFGEWEGKRWSELERQPEFCEWMQDWQRATPPGGESLPELHARVERWLTLLDEGREDRQLVLALTHAGVIRSLRVHLEHGSWDGVMREKVAYLRPMSWCL